jgi:hypothetical protein
MAREVLVDYCRSKLGNDCAAGEDFHYELYDCAFKSAEGEDFYYELYDCAFKSAEGEDFYYVGVRIRLKRTSSCRSHLVTGRAYA